MTRTWDYLVLTASNDRQAAGYESQLAIRRSAGLLPEVGSTLVVADPFGKRVGSGGSTLYCLMRVVEAELQRTGATAGDMASIERILPRPASPDSACWRRFPSRAGLWAVRQDFLARAETTTRHVAG